MVLNCFNNLVQSFRGLVQNLGGVLVLLIVAVGWIFDRWLLDIRRKRRRNYYRNEYLKADAWERKRYLVLKRDDHRCVYCGSVATQVHHERYSRSIGREPIDWLVSVCNIATRKYTVNA
jgi:hypothetical protein